mgnify:CR=1 FL=1
MMLRSSYSHELLNNGFAYDSTAKNGGRNARGFPVKRGTEDIFVHPAYDFKFYVSKVYADSDEYGFFTGKTNTALLDTIYPHNIKTTDWRPSGKDPIPGWTDEAFMALMSKM